MARSDDIVAYTYRADLYTPIGIVARLLREQGWNGVSATNAALATTDVEGFLDSQANERDIYRYDESSYDSDVFPKVVFRDQVEDPDQTFQNGYGEYVTADDLGLV